MDKIIAYCGLVCTDCPAYIAKQTDDNELREKTAKEWATAFNPDIRAEMINCDGCNSKDTLFFHCNHCKIRACCIEKGIDNCAYCDDYICDDKLKPFIDNAPNAKILLDEIKKNC